MKEILKDVICDYKWDELRKELIKIRQYHIYYDKINKCIYVDVPFPVRHMKKLRDRLDYIKIEYFNIIIGKPDI